MAEVGLTQAVVIPPRYRGRLHQIAFVIAIPAGILLIASSRGVTAHVASALFVCSLLALFGASGTYHMKHWPPAIKARLQRLDHAMIFVLIAGSYTPITLLALDPAWGITFLVLAWGIAAGGAILALWHIRIIHRYAAFLYIGFGWLLVLALPAVLRALDTPELILLATGGILYTLGAIGLWLKFPNPSPKTFGYHEVWHAMTLAAAGCHYVLVLMLVRGCTGRVTARTVTRIPVRMILHDVGASYRHRFGRVIIAAALVFGATAVIGAAIEDFTHRAEPNFLIWTFALAGTAMSQVGITFYAGLLDKVVGEFELGEEPEPVMHVLRTLPYGSLIVADILITVASGIGLLLLVIPGLILFTLFAISGPVINIEHVGAIKGMRRSAHLVRPHFWLVFLLVTVPIGIEEQVLHWANELVLHHALIEVFIVQGITGMIVGSFVGLVEVNVAYALELNDPTATA